MLLMFGSRFGFFLEWHINLRGLFNAKSILVIEEQWYYLTYCLRDKEVHTFPKGISTIVFELVYFEATFKHFTHYAMGSRPFSSKIFGNAMTLGYDSLQRRPLIKDNSFQRTKSKTTLLQIRLQWSVILTLHWFVWLLVLMA